MGAWCRWATNPGARSGANGGSETRAVAARRFLQRLVHPADPVGRIDPVRVAVIDVGSNTARLMVAEQRRGRPQRIGEAKAYLGLGAEIIRRGHVGLEKLSETGVEMARFTAIARELAAEEIDVFVTAPARQAANADQLVATISRATGRPVRVLSAREEGELGYEGALATTSVASEPVAVCDVGGGSTEVTVGTRKRGPFWSDSVDLGSLRLTATTLYDDPPTAKQLAEAEALVSSLLGALDPPEVGTGLAVGGSARALARLTGRALDEASLDRSLAMIVSQPSVQLAHALSVDEPRAATLAAGAIILRELTRRLGVPLQLAGGGLRDGAAARLFAASEAA
jgi:exopolyphosphatase/guanosine-5'-triphosphate,3'-diphosphate pyrophosphatase